MIDQIQIEKIMQDTLPYTWQFNDVRNVSFFGSHTEKYAVCTNMFKMAQ